MMRPCWRLLPLFRPKLSLLNGVAAGGGFLLLPTVHETGALWRVMAGVTFLAAAASAANQVLEQDLDRLMARTRSRPLPSGVVTPRAAWGMAGIALVSGLLLLAPGGLPPVFQGGATLAWYLGVYTPLKRRTPFALLAGGLCGAMGPVIGWCSAGGSVTDYRIILLAALLYLWQVPHFWLCQQRHQEEYRGAGIPLLAPRATGEYPTALCRLWIIALLAGSLLPAALGLIARGLLVWYGGALLTLGGLALIGPERSRFASLNLLPLLIPLVLLVQGW